MTVLEKQAQTIMDAKGYFVIAFSRGPLPIPKPGDVYREPIGDGVSETLHPPFVCIGYATKEEYLSQARILESSERTMEFARHDAESAIAFLKVVAE